MKSIKPQAVAYYVRNLSKVATLLNSGKRFMAERLMPVKKLCRDHADTIQFAAHLAKNTQIRVANDESLAKNKALIDKAVSLILEFASAEKPSASLRKELRSLLPALEQTQRLFITPNTNNRIRIIEDWNALVIETSVHCLLTLPRKSGVWGYRLAKHYSERTNPNYGTGILTESAPFVAEIANFWSNYYFAKEAVTLGPPSPPEGPMKWKTKAAMEEDEKKKSEGAS